MTLRRTYEIEEPPSPAMAWQMYERVIMAEWSQLLDSQPPPTEPAVHSFLEQHPSMVPGAFNIIGGNSGHHPVMSALISQPPLPSYDRRIPDFMWLSTNSEIDEPVLIEIEAPGKRWFTKSGAQTAHLTQALGQIADWKAWMAVPHNVEAFKAFYGLDRLAWQRRRFRPAYLLIYGRRAEASATPVLTQRRGHLHSDDIVSMTFDRLQPNPQASQLICIKAESAGRFKAISVPPTLKWCPLLAEDRSMISDFPAAIEANQHITLERKQFLIRRFPYWNEWATKGQRGFANTGDEE
jgi:hypothetical protein